MISTYRITHEMLQAGSAALLQCHELGGHTPQTTCQAVFTAMLSAADIHPGKNLRKSFEWSLHDTRRDAMGRRRRLPANPLTRADFDVRGIRKTLLPDGSTHYQMIWNYWYLLPDWRAEKAARDLKITKT